MFKLILNKFRSFRTRVPPELDEPLLLNGPLVSVVIPNHNNELYIRECIVSVQKQTYKDIEIIVVDDSSIDRSIEIIEDLADDRTVLVKLGKQTGVSAVRNHGIMSAKGEFLTTLDGDDVFNDPEKISRELGIVLKCMKKWKKDVVGFSNICRISEHGKLVNVVGDNNTIKEGNIRKEIYDRSVFIPRDFLCAKRVYIEAGLYDEEIPLYEDWDLKLRISDLCEFYYTGVVGVGYRMRDNGLSKSPDAEHIKWREYIREKNSDVEIGDR